MADDEIPPPVLFNPIDDFDEEALADAQVTDDEVEFEDYVVAADEDLDEEDDEEDPEDDPEEDPEDDLGGDQEEIPDEIPEDIPQDHVEDEDLEDAGNEMSHDPAIGPDWEGRLERARTMANMEVAELQQELQQKTDNYDQLQFAYEFLEERAEQTDQRADQMKE